MQGSLINRLSERSKQPTPVVGMHCTIMCYSDRRPEADHLLPRY
jgi:hypothetical protein